MNKSKLPFNELTIPIITRKAKLYGELVKLIYEKGGCVNNGCFFKNQSFDHILNLILPNGIDFTIVDKDKSK